MAIKNTKNKRRKNISKYKVNLSVVIVIILVSVLAGYIATKYIIYPVILGIEPETLDDNIKLPFGIDSIDKDNGNMLSENNAANKQVDNTDNINSVDNVDNADNYNEQQSELVANSYENIYENQAKEKLQQELKDFCIQYGSFSTHEGAEVLQQQLKETGIQADIIEKDGTFKVISQLFATKEEAIREKDKNKGLYEDAFITSF